MRSRRSIALPASICFRGRLRCRRRSTGTSRISTTPLTPPVPSTPSSVPKRSSTSKIRATSFDPCAACCIPAGSWCSPCRTRSRFARTAGLIFAGHFTHFLGRLLPGAHHCAPAPRPGPPLCRERVHPTGVSVHRRRRDSEARARALAAGVVRPAARAVVQRQRLRGDAGDGRPQSCLNCTDRVSSIDTMA